MKSRAQSGSAPEKSAGFRSSHKQRHRLGTDFSRPDSRKLSCDSLHRQARPATGAATDRVCHRSRRRRVCATRRPSINDCFAALTSLTGDVASGPSRHDRPLRHPGAAPQLLAHSSSLTNFPALRAVMLIPMFPQFRLRCRSVCLQSSTFDRCFLRALSYCLIAGSH